MSWRPVKNFNQETHHPILSHSELQWIDARELMRRIRQKSQETPTSARPRAIVFDLDSTLFCTTPRLRRIMIQYVSANATLDPVWTKVAHEVNSADQRYSVPGTLFHLLKRHRNAADAETLVRDFWPAFDKYWREEFFLSRHMTVDPPYEGSVEFVKQTVELGYSPIYLTGRDFGRGMEGTRHALRRWGYPLGPDSHTILKPNRETKDLEFKQYVARILGARFDVHFVIDNEPENLAMFASIIPTTEIVFFHSIMSGRWSAQELKRDLAGRKILGLKSFLI